MYDALALVCPIPFPLLSTKSLKGLSFPLQALVMLQTLVMLPALFMRTKQGLGSTSDGVQRQLCTWPSRSQIAFSVSRLNASDEGNMDDQSFLSCDFTGGTFFWFISR